MATDLRAAHPLAVTKPLPGMAGKKGRTPRKKGSSGSPPGRGGGGGSGSGGGGGGGGDGGEPAVRFVPAALEHVSPRACDAARDPFAQPPVSPEEMQLIGERLYPLVCDLVRAEPEVVTGMLLELPKTEIEELLLSPVDLRQHVQECEQALSERVVRSPSQPAAIDPDPTLRQLEELVTKWGQTATRQQDVPLERSAVHLYMYGSCLLGAATPDSDIDVLVAVPRHICRVRHFFGLTPGVGKQRGSHDDS
eukprot:COSAG01_NODE_17930_length_1113_cov_2.251479_1_plen_249_part_01